MLPAQTDCDPGGNRSLPLCLLGHFRALGDLLAPRPGTSRQPTSTSLRPSVWTLKQQIAHVNLHPQPLLDERQIESAGTTGHVPRRVAGPSPCGAAQTTGHNPSRLGSIFAPVDRGCPRHACSGLVGAPLPWRAPLRFGPRLQDLVDRPLTAAGPDPDQPDSTQINGG